MTIPEENLKAYYDFINEREAIRLRREAGMAFPWSEDVIFQTYRFTNVKRIHDKTTAWLKKNRYDKNRDRPYHEILINCAVNRWFGTIEFSEDIGWQQDWRPEFIIKRGEARLRRGLTVFTGAYLISNNGIHGSKPRVVVENFLQRFVDNCEDLATVCKETQSWEAAAKRMYQIKGFGGSGFMTKEILQDAILTPVLENAHDVKTWTPVGPGGRRGLNRMLGRELKATIEEDEALEEIRNILNASEKYAATYMPELDMHDIQFQLCEFDKYERARLNQGRPKRRYDYTGAW